MKRGELYRVSATPPQDPRPRRTCVVVSRQELIDSTYGTVICAPVYSQRGGLDSEVAVGPDEGLLHDSAVRCDDLMSLPKNLLTTYVGSLNPAKLDSLDLALAAALGIRMPSR